MLSDGVKWSDTSPKPKRFIHDEGSANPVLLLFKISLLHNCKANPDRHPWFCTFLIALNFLIRSVSHPSLSLGEKVLVVPAGYDVSMNEVIKYNYRFIKLISVLNSFVISEWINCNQSKVLFKGRILQKDLLFRLLLYVLWKGQSELMLKNTWKE